MRGDHYTHTEADAGYYAEAFNEPDFDPRDELDQEELADYYKHRGDRPSRGGSHAMVRRARAGRAS